MITIQIQVISFIDLLLAVLVTWGGRKLNFLFTFTGDQRDDHRLIALIAADKDRQPVFLLKKFNTTRI